MPATERLNQSWLRHTHEDLIDMKEEPVEINGTRNFCAAATPCPICEENTEVQELTYNYPKGFNLIQYQVLSGHSSKTVEIQK